MVGRAHAPRPKESPVDVPIPFLGQLLPVDPQVAIDTTKAMYEGFRRDFIIATVIMLVVQNVGWAWAMVAIVRKLSAVHESRVQDGKDGERRAEKLLDRMAVHMDRASEATTVTNMILLGRTQSGEHPIVKPPT